MSSCSTYRTMVVVFMLLWTLCCGQDGYYGPGRLSCGHCAGGKSCDNSTGDCIECEPGYDPNSPKCDKVCRHSYGPKCRLKCNKCSNGEECHHITGHCPKGCQEGFLGLLCDVACSAGTYGQNCIKRCGQCADEEVCNHVSGHCTTGCQPGYIGSRCDVECEDGRWGDNCNETCGHCAENATCRKDDGLCPMGCELNFLMPTCTDLPPQPWSNCSCEILYVYRMAVFTLSPVLGVVLMIMIAALCILCQRHRSSSRSLRALRQETKLNEVHRQLKETLMPRNFESSSSQSPQRSRVTSFALGQGAGRRSGGDPKRNVPLDVSEGGTAIDENAEEYLNWNHGLRPYATPVSSGPPPCQKLYLNMNDSTSRKHGRYRGGPNRNKSSSADQEEIYVNEL